MRRLGLVVCSAVLGLSAIACKDGDSADLARHNPFPEEHVDEGPAPTVETLPTNQTVTVAGMSGSVTVVFDNRGMPHIYAANLADALRAQGYVMARDRFPQMEFIRRAVTGTLTEVISPVAGVDATLGDDMQARFFGFKRVAQTVYDGLDPADTVKTSVDAFTAGVNAYIDEILAERAKGSSANLTRFVPRGAGLFNAVIASPFFGHWEPADVVAIARYQTFVLSFDQADSDRSQAELAATTNFPSPAQGIATLLDMAAYAPSRNVYSNDAGGPDPTTPKVHAARTAPSPVLTPGGVTPSFTSPPSQAAISAAARWGKSARNLARFIGDVERGSNNWVVSGAHTKSGAPILANDPHLSLTSPAVWYYTHLTATAEGIDAEGVAFAGLPGVVLGFSKDLAWGATVTNFDVVDFYAFDSSTNVNTGNGQAHVVTQDGVTNMGPTTVEVIRTGPASPAGDVPVPIYVVPNFGQLLLDETGESLDFGVRTTTFDPSNELGFFLRLLTSKTVADARSAQATYFKNGSQNFVMAATNGDIAWQTYSRVPHRPDLATAWPGPPTVPNDPSQGLTSMCPTFVLPASAGFAWDGDIDPTTLPSLLNPAKGWIATANNDSIGVNRDGNPCNDSVYLGGDYDPGHREFRIASELTRLTARGDITVEDMQALQGASRSSLGETTRDAIVASLAVSIASGDYDNEQTALLQDAHNRLFAWSLETPAGTDTADATIRANSVATTVFNVGITRIIAMAFGDEASRLGVNPPAAPLLERALAVSADDELGMLTFSDALGDTFLWDDLDTGALETRNVIIANAFLESYDVLEERLGASRDNWTWGRLHTVIFKTLIPPTGLDVQSIPGADDARFATGFPRHSDWGAVDVGNYDLWNGDNSSIQLEDFMYTSGPSQRLVVEMLPDGPKAYNALPGGQSQYPDSRHHADEAALWVNNQAPQLAFTPEEVAAAAERKIVLTP